MPKTPFIMVEPFDDFEGIFCPACGSNLWEGTECHHLMFSFTEEDDEFCHSSATFENQQSSMEEAIAEKDGKSFKFETIFHKHDTHDCDFVFKVKFPDATGFGEMCTYFGIDFDAEASEDINSTVSVPVADYVPSHGSHSRPSDE